ncbi:hypothetical protein HDU83_004199 [Entophlyctis luteolus]|nr:hypothetical protein HDU83_004199 [Entophlyctis luteolus]KAJ3380496.1 hypothetical protein HDU84_005779 [Entophlyctis sp. JEL0112]
MDQQQPAAPRQGASQTQTWNLDGTVVGAVGVRGTQSPQHLSLADLSNTQPDSAMSRPTFAQPSMPPLSPTYAPETPIRRQMSRHAAAASKRLTAHERDCLRDAPSDSDDASGPPSRHAVASPAVVTNPWYSDCDGGEAGEDGDVLPDDMRASRFRSIFRSRNLGRSISAVSGDASALDGSLQRQGRSTSIRSRRTTTNTASTQTSDNRKSGGKFMSRSQVFSIAARGLFGSSTTWRLDMEQQTPVGGDLGAKGVNPLKERLDQITFWTKQTPLPTIGETIKEYRFILRMFQLSFVIGKEGSFASLSVGTFRADFFTSVLDAAGISFMAFICISAAFLSFSWLVVYTNPSNLGIPPHRHPRISRIELILDMAFVALWFSACVNMADKISIACSNASDSRHCLSWDLGLAFGYASGAAFAASAILGVCDIRLHDLSIGKLRHHSRAVEARGGWVQAKVLRKTKDGVQMLVDEFDD